MGFGDASLLVKISFICVIVGFIVYLIGFASPYWNSATVLGTKYHNGLWQACRTSCSEYGYVSDKLQAARAFACIGFITGLASVVLCALYIFLSQASNKLVYIITFACCFATAGCILLAVLIYASVASGMDWAWGFCIVALIIYNVSGVLLVANPKASS